MTAEKKIAVEERLDELYREHPEGFVAGRNGLVKEVRAAGDREEADRVKKLRRPSVAAWLINRTALSSPDRLEEFDETSRRLEEAQARALEGDDKAVAEWRAAAGREREATAAVLETAASLAGESGHSVKERALELAGETLLAAAGDPELRSPRPLSASPPMPQLDGAVLTQRSGVKRRSPAASSSACATSSTRRSPERSGFARTWTGRPRPCVRTRPGWPTRSARPPVREGSSKRRSEGRRSEACLAPRDERHVRMPRGIRGRTAAMEHDPRPRYFAGGALFLVAAVFMLIVGLPLATFFLALIAAGLFYYFTKVKTVP
jgi:hypothetical protein